MTFFLQQSLNGLVIGSVFALYALGFSLVFANLKAFHIAHAGVFTWGAVLAWHLTTEWGWSLLPTVVVVAGACGLLNVFVYLVALRHLERRKGRDLAFFASSLGAGVILTELALEFLDGATVRLPFDLFTQHTWMVGGISVSSMQVLMLGTSAVVLVVLAYLVDSTEFGREMRTVAFDRELASMLGIRVWRVTIMVFFLSGTLAGIGATLIGLAFNSIHANLGNTYLITAIAVLVIGGLGSILGGFIGGMLIGLVIAYTTGYWTSSYSEVVVYALLLAFLVARPSGIFASSDVAARA